MSNDAQKKINKNLFGAVVTHRAPAANYRGEAENSRSPLQKITDGRIQRTIVNADAIRNALRDTLASYGLPMNRSRVYTSDQPAVKYEDFPNPDVYADDFIFGYMVVDKSFKTKVGDKRPAKRNSILLINIATALEPYRYDAIFHQSPKIEGEWQNASSSSLLYREVTYTEYQFPFGMNLNDFRIGEEPYEDWFRWLLRAFSELGNVAGNHARSLYSFEPASVLLRLTPNLAPGFDLSNAFSEETLKDIMGMLKEGDLPGDEFYIGGKVVREMPEELRSQLERRGVELYRSPLDCFDRVSRDVCGKGIPDRPEGVA